LKQPQLAGNRFAQLIERYPESPYVRRIELDDDYTRFANEAAARKTAAKKKKKDSAD